MDDGKDVDALDSFCKKIKGFGVRIKAISTDLSPAFVSSVITNAPDATLVFGHFHVVKLMNDALDEIRRSMYKKDKYFNNGKVLKGVLLACFGLWC